MSIEEDFESYMSDDEMVPEDVFQMVTIMPKRKIKMVAYLEDKDGERITLATIASNLKEYITKHLDTDENTPVNTQLFPLINQMMVSAVPRHVGFELAAFLFTAKGSRYALSTYGLQIALLMRYIEQHKLKIVTEETNISDQELQDYMDKSEQAEERLRFAMTGGQDGPGEA